MGRVLQILRRAIQPPDYGAVANRMLYLMDVHLRGINPEIWRALRVEALQRGISVARLIEELWRAKHA